MKKVTLSFVAGLFSIVVFAFEGKVFESTLMDSTSKSNEQRKTNREFISEKVILKMYSRSGEIFDQECESKILVSIKSGLVKSLGINCEDEYSLFNYYEGKIISSNIEGESSFFDNCGGSGDGPMMCMANGQFTMKLSSDLTKLELNEMTYSSSPLQFSFNTKALKIYEMPSFDSKIMEELKNNNLKVELIEIGNLEKKGEKWDVWYKIKTSTNEGWCFGHLNL